MTYAGIPELTDKALTNQLPLFSNFVGDNSKLQPKPSFEMITAIMQGWAKDCPRHLLEFKFKFDEDHPQYSIAPVRFAFSPHEGSTTPDQLETLWVASEEGVECGWDAYQGAAQSRMEQYILEACIIKPSNPAYLGKVSPSSMDKWVETNFADVFYDEDVWQLPPAWWSMGVVHTELAFVLQLLESARRYMLKSMKKADLVAGMPASMPVVIQHYVEKLFEMSGVLDKDHVKIKLYSQAHIHVFALCRAMNAVSTPKDIKKKAYDRMNKDLGELVKPLVEAENMRRSAGITREEEAASSESEELDDLEPESKRPKKAKKGEPSHR
jgi:hypothetical protein